MRTSAASSRPTRSERGRAWEAPPSCTARRSSRATTVGRRPRLRRWFTAADAIRPDPTTRTVGPGSAVPGECQVDRTAGKRARGRPQRRLPVHPGGDTHRCGEQLTQRSADDSGGAGRPGGGAHLGPDLRLAEDSGLQAGGDAEQVGDCCLAHPDLRGADGPSRRRSAPLGQHVDQAIGPHLVSGRVDLGATARDQQHHLGVPRCPDAASTAPRRSAGTATRSSSANGAVRWLRPTMTTVFIVSPHKALFRRPHQNLAKGP